MWWESGVYSITQLRDAGGHRSAGRALGEARMQCSFLRLNSRILYTRLRVEASDL